MRLFKPLVPAAAFALAALLVAAPAGAVPNGDSYTFVLPPVNMPNAGVAYLWLTNPNGVAVSYSIVAEDLSGGNVDVFGCAPSPALSITHRNVATSQFCGTSGNAVAPITLGANATDYIQIGLGNGVARRVQLRYDVLAGTSVGPATLTTVNPGTLPLLADLSVSTTNEGLIAVSQMLTRDSLR